MLSRMQTCLFYVGGENDEWVEDILESPEMEDVKRLRLVDCVGNILAEEHVEGMKEERGHSQEDEEEESHDEEGTFSSFCRRNGRRA